MLEGAQTLAQSIGGAGTGVFSIGLYMDATYAKRNNYYGVLYCMFRMLFRTLFRMLILIMFTNFLFHEDKCVCVSMITATSGNFNAKGC